MDITNQVLELRKLCNDTKLIKSFLRFDFNYKTQHSFMLYSNAENLKSSFIICWDCNHTVYMQSYQIINVGDRFTFNPFIENDIYKGLNPYYKFNAGDVVIYFNNIFNKLNLKEHKKVPYSCVKSYVKSENTKGIYFFTFKRLPIRTKTGLQDKMSIEMYNKIVQYTNRDIVNFLKKIKMTAVFTLDIANARDINEEFFAIRKI